MVDVALGAAYDPASDTWRGLPTRPVAGPVQSTVWTGEEVVTLVANRSDPTFPAGDAVGLAYDPAGDSWEQLPPTGVAESPAELVWDGEQAVAVSHDQRSSAYRPDDGTWAPLAAIPLRDYECQPVTAAVGEIVLTNQCSGWGLLTDDGEWAIAPLPETPAGSLVTAGDVVLSWWSTDEYFNFEDAPVTYLQSFRAPELRPGDLALARTIPMGSAFLDLPADTRLSGTDHVEEAGGLVTRLRYELEEPDCTLESTAANVGGAGARIRNDLAEVEADFSHIDFPQFEGVPRRALVARVAPRQLDDRAHVLFAETDFTVLDIACADPPAADDILSRLHR
jgi:hypothetical protein